MKNLATTIALLLLLSSCNAPIQKAASKETTKETAIKSIKTVEKKAPTLTLASITQTLSELFDIQNAELKPASKHTQEGFHKLLDATRIKSFQRLPKCNILEYDNATIAAAEFKKIKAIAAKSSTNIHQLVTYGRIFEKGGRSINQADRWIITHDLGCNVMLSDYEIDKQFTTELEALGFEVDWVRTYCGWGKLAIK